MSFQKYIADVLRADLVHDSGCEKYYRSRGRSCPDCGACTIADMADEIEDGYMSDYFGPKDPTLQDVREHAVKVLGPDAVAFSYTFPTDYTRESEVRVWRHSRDHLTSEAPILAVPLRVAIVALLALGDSYAK